MRERISVGSWEDWTGEIVVGVQYMRKESILNNKEKQVKLKPANNLSNYSDQSGK